MTRLLHPVQLSGDVPTAALFPNPRIDQTLKECGRRPGIGVEPIRRHDENSAFITGWCERRRRRRLSTLEGTSRGLGTFFGVRHVGRGAM